MTWTVNQTELYGGVNRVPRIHPWCPARTEYIGNNTKQASSADIGKAVKLSGDTVVVCAAGDPIYGFIESVEAGSFSGYSIGGVLADPSLEAIARDEAGTLAVGDSVVAGTPTALGAALHANGFYVKKDDTAVQTFPVTGLLQSGALGIGTTSKKALRNTATIIASVGGTPVTKTAAETALSGTVVNATYNVFALFTDASGTLTTVMGTAGATADAVVIPQSTTARTRVGYALVHPTGTGNFVGGTTDLDDGTVVPNAVYVNEVPHPVQTVQSAAGAWVVMAVYGSGAGRKVLLRKF